MADERTAAEKAGFTGGDAVAPRGVGEAREMGKEASSIQAAMAVAMRYPRNEGDCYTRLVEACARPTFAEEARYVFPRGGKTITGPSVKFAREAGRCWGHIRFGTQFQERTDQQTVGIGWAWDLQTNTYVESAFAVKHLIQRKRGGRTEWEIPDERDLRELLNKSGAIAVRNSLLQILPSDVVEDALRKVVETLTLSAKGEVAQDRGQAARRLVVAFRDFGVSGEMIASRLGHDLDLITEDEIVELRGIWRSIHEGNSTRDEFFPTDGAKPAAKKKGNGNGKAQSLDDLAAQGTGEEPPHPAEVPPPTPPPAAPPPEPAKETPEQIMERRTAGAKPAEPAPAVPDPATGEGGGESLF